MNKVLFPVIFLLMPPFRYFLSPSFEHPVFAADSFYYLKDYPHAAAYYDTFMIKNGVTPEALFNQAGSYALAGEKDKAFAALEKSIGKGFKHILYLTHCKDLAPLYHDKRWKQVLQHCGDSLAAYEKTITLPAVRRELLERYEYDQYSDFIQVIQRHYGVLAEISYDSVIADKKRHYQADFTRINVLTAQYGALGADKVGKDGAQAYFIFAQHADFDPDGQAGCLELMKQGGFTKMQIAFLTDRVLKNHGKPQLYGTQNWLNKEKRVWERYPVADEAHLADRRKEMGLP